MSIWYCMNVFYIYQAFGVRMNEHTERWTTNPHRSQTQWPLNMCAHSAYSDHQYTLVQYSAHSIILSSICVRWIMDGLVSSTFFFTKSVQFTRFRRNQLKSINFGYKRKTRRMPFHHSQLSDVNVSTIISARQYFFQFNSILVVKTKSTRRFLDNAWKKTLITALLRLFFRAFIWFDFNFFFAFFRFI